MIKVDRILCPTDLSTESDEALRYATALARAYDAKLFLLHCSDASLVGQEEEEISKIDRQLTRQFAASLAPYLDMTAASELDWEGIIRHGVYNIGRGIALEALRQNADLIVMRSRRRPRAAVLLGSTAEAVCRVSPCAVLVTHPREREWVGMSTGEVDLRRVLVAHDFSRDSEIALHYGLSLAQEYQAEVHLMHVLSTAGHDEPEMAWSSATGGSAYTFTAKKLQQALPAEVSLWCKTVNVVRSGKVYVEVLAYAEQHEIDLICMGASGGDWSMARMLGSNVDRVLRHTPCPVLVGRSRGNSYSGIQN